ncbi:PIG-L family deacetylase [Streptomyces sp. NPDC050619]|uniref:PIG-L family deacetylase n=1 Tax=Streptomyces sp. NPDC050619 TaxID=3157214 RepID=UPI00343C9FF3
MTRTPERSSFLNIVAHQDDDLLFMNPDIGEALRAGARNTTVYITAGEAHYRASDTAVGPLADQQACKRGGDDLLGRTAPGALSRGQYVDCRRRGILAAYAAMLGADVADVADVADAADARPLWEARPLAVGGGRLAERFVSALSPAVSLVFLNLPENADGGVEGGPQALRRLWSVPGAVVRTVGAAGSLLGDRTFRYDRDGLVAALLSIMTWARPTVVRSLDACPDTRYQGTWEYHDHTDHVMTGLFASRAVEAHDSSGRRRGPLLLSYRGYNTADSPANLRAGPVLDGKSAAFWTYAAYDTEVHPANHHEYRAWLSRMYYRWPFGNAWAETDVAGGIHAFAVVGNELRVWWRTSDNDWRTQGLGRPAGRILTPGVSACRTSDGAVSVFVLGHGQRLDGAGAAPQVFWVRLTDGENRRPVWRDLGSPGRGGFHERHVGQPVTCVDGDGRVHVYVRTPDGGLSGRRQSDRTADAFDDWTFLGGSGIQHEPAAVRNREGGVDVFAGNAGGGILHWRQDPADPVPRRRPALPSADLCGSPTAVLGNDGQVGVHYRVAGSGAVLSQHHDGATWRAGPVRRCPDGIGPLAATAPPGDPRAGAVLLVSRDVRGGVSALRVRRDDEGEDGDGDRGAWTPLGSTAAGEPTALLDRRGRVHVLVLGTDGALHTIEQTHPAAEFGFGPWRSVPAHPENESHRSSSIGIRFNAPS